MTVRARLLLGATVVFCTSAAVAQRPAPRPTPRPASPPPTVLARINQFNVTMPYFQRVVEGRYAREVMEEIVRLRVIEDEAAANKVSIAHEAVTAELERQKQQLGGEQAFADHLAQMGYSLKAFREHLRMQLLLDALMDKAAFVTDEEAKAYYEAHKGEFGAQAELHIMDIAAADRADAMVAYRALVDGTPFPVVARRYSALPTPKSDGDLGWVSKDKVGVAGLWELADALKEGDVSEPYELDGKFHIVRLVAHRPAGTKTFEQAKPQILAALREKQGITEADYVTSLIAKANIQVPWAPVAYLESEYKAYKGIRVTVDGKPLRLSAAPFTGPAGVILVPAKPVLQALGASVVWHSGAKILEATKGTTKISVTMGEKMANVNGELKDMTAAPVIKDGVLYAPLRVLASALGAGVQWNATTKVLAVNSAAGGGRG